MKTIKKHFYCVSMLLAASVWQSLADDTNKWGAVACNAQVSIALQDSATEIKAGDSVDLSIQVKNVSTNEAFNVYENDNALSFAITAPSGKDVSPAPSKDESSTSGMVLHIPPQQSKGFEFSPNCKFDEIGTYKITAKISIQDCQVTSNPLSVTVANE